MSVSQSMSVYFMEFQMISTSFYILLFRKNLVFCLPPYPKTHLHPQVDLCTNTPAGNIDTDEIVCVAKMASFSQKYCQKSVRLGSEMDDTRSLHYLLQQYCVTLCCTAIRCKVYVFDKGRRHSVWMVVTCVCWMRQACGSV